MSWGEHPDNDKLNYVSLTFFIIAFMSFACWICNLLNIE